MNPKTVMLIGTIAVVAGSAMPWAVMSHPFVGTVTINGLQGDGVLTMASGILMLFIALVIKKRPSKMASPINLVLAIITGIFTLSKIASLSSVIAESDIVSTSLGAGLWVLLIGSVVILVGSASSWPGEPDTVAEAVPTETAEESAE